jgi:hypothetical protein
MSVSGMWRYVDPGLTDISEERIAVCKYLLTLISRSRIFLRFPANGYFYPEGGGDTFL